MEQYWVYILASRSKRLYIGVTRDLDRRLAEHRSGRGSAFAARYAIDRLVHCEEQPRIADAIAREKELKGWRREKKLRLIEADNAEWQDLVPR